MENGGGRDLEEKETFLLARNPIYDQEWLWDNEVLSLFLFSFRQSLRSVSFKEERSSCTTITQKLEKTGFGWRGFFSLKNHSPKCKKKKKRCCYFASNTPFKKSSKMSRVNSLKVSQFRTKNLLTSKNSFCPFFNIYFAWEMILTQDLSILKGSKISFHKLCYIKKARIPISIPKIGFNLT